MQIYRLFINIPLQLDGLHCLNENQAHYIRSVIRLNVNDVIEVFNGVDGLWRAKIVQLTKKLVEIVCEVQLKPQTPSGTFDVYFAPLKNPRLEYVVQKQVEMGARSITPVKTQHTQMQHFNNDRLQSYIIEAAEQCGILSLPKLNPLIELKDIFSKFSSQNILIYCDENAAVQNPLAALKNLPIGTRCALLIGPEGGFSIEERIFLHAQHHIMPIALGPRILRADTALVAAMTILQAINGDW